MNINPILKTNLKIENNSIVKENFYDNLKHLINPSYHTSSVQKIAARIEKEIFDPNNPQKKTFLEMGDKLISHYAHDSSVKDILRVFDQRLSLSRKKNTYLLPSNLSMAEKWAKASQPKEILRYFPEFCAFLNDSKILSQMKVTKDTLTMLEGEPALLVEGRLMKANALMQHFSITRSKDYQESFVIDQNGSVYTYLDNGKGLQRYHPFLDAGKTPISILSKEEIKNIQDMASKFVRPEESDLDEKEQKKRLEQRPFVIQIVSSNTGEGKTNLHQMLFNPRHTYLRIVLAQDLPKMNMKKGEVYEFGFCFKNKRFLPMQATQGRFRSPDGWEYKDCASRFTTHIPISSQETENALKYALQYINRNVQLGRQIGFQYAHQNCTVFVRKTLEQAGISVPTQIALPNLIHQIAPNEIKKIAKEISFYAKEGISIGKTLIRATPPPVSQALFKVANIVHNVFIRIGETLAAFALTPIRTILGGLLGDGGDSFEEGQKIEAPNRNIRNWFDFSTYQYNLPVIVQKWQKNQASTDEIHHPIQLTTVPQQKFA